MRTLPILLTLIVPIVIYVAPCRGTTKSKSTTTSASSFLNLPECASAAGISQKDTLSINSVLRSIVSNSTFFSLFSVDLDKDCPFWPDDSLCYNRYCSVNSCEDDEIPPNYRSSPCPTASSSSPSSATDSDTSDQLQHSVDRSLTGLAALVGPPPCIANAAWTTRDDNDKTVYVDLRSNPEKHTGYSGPSAQRVWNAIYRENCFEFSAKCSSGICSPDTCKEERVLYRLISGLHSSITMHIAREYYFETFGFWGKNVDIYKERLKNHPERITNLNVVYAIVLRAVSKAAPYLHPSSQQHKKIDYKTGNVENDNLTENLLQQLFDLEILNPTCETKVFDESDMFLTDQQHLLPEFRDAFRNISTIMDCVGCEKCRLWGKLQFLGLGTAMRILFEKEMPQFERNDVIALINLLYKLSTSVLMVETMNRKIQQTLRMYFKLGVGLGITVLFTLSILAHSEKLKKQKEKETTDPKNTELIKKAEKPDNKQNAIGGRSLQSSVTESEEKSATNSVLESQSTPTTTLEGPRPNYTVTDDSENATSSPRGKSNGQSSDMKTPTPTKKSKGNTKTSSDDELQKSAPRRSERLRKRSVARAD